MSKSLAQYAINNTLIAEEISMDCEGLVQAKVVFSNPLRNKVEVGDFIYYNEECGKELYFENKIYFIVNEDHVQFFLKGPK